MTATLDARLEVNDAQGRRVVVLDKPTFTIGRRSANDLQLTGTDVSRDHAEILRTTANTSFATAARAAARTSTVPP